MLTLRSLGHACFQLSTADKSVILDPWLKGNPEAVCGPEDVTVDAILVTHGHSDHFGDALAIAQRLRCPIIAVAELARYCSRQGVEAIGMHLGGSRLFDFGRVKLTLALHGSGIAGPQGTEYVGPPCGFLLTMGGVTVYFAGDTGLFGDMRLIGDTVRVDVAILPIGDNYTMGPHDALLAAEMLRPRLVIPCHYGAFPVIKQDPGDLAEELDHRGIGCQLLRPGEALDVPPEEAVVE